MPLRIGLTGGIGSGKSTVAAMLARRGAFIVDTDAIARRLTGADGSAMPALRLTFGDAIAGPDGALDREWMRALVFADPGARRRLEAVLHPLIGAEARAEAETVTSDVVVFDVPLLAESPHWRRRVARVLVIDCTHETQVARVVLRGGWTRDAAERVIANQAARSARRAIADAVIFNDGIDLDALDAAVDAVWRLWQVMPQDPVEQ
ncbi:MAG TPA: dephospho-CoA kinase [Burkholderiaceae bacterium]